MSLETEYDDEDDSDVTLTEIYSPSDDMSFKEIVSPSGGSTPSDATASPVSPAQSPLPRSKTRVLSCIIEEDYMTAESLPTKPRVMDLAARQDLTSFLLEASPPVSPITEARLSWSYRAVAHPRPQTPANKVTLFPAAGIRRGLKTSDQRAVLLKVDRHGSATRRLGNTARCEYVGDAQRSGFDDDDVTARVPRLRSKLNAVRSTFARMFDRNDTPAVRTSSRKVSNGSSKTFKEEAPIRKTLSRKTSLASLTTTNEDSSIMRRLKRKVSSNSLNMSKDNGPAPVLSHHAPKIPLSVFGRGDATCA